jgi:hypothetical protein
MALQHSHLGTSESPCGDARPAAGLDTKLVRMRRTHRLLCICSLVFRFLEFSLVLFPFFSLVFLIKLAPMVLIDTIAASSVGERPNPGTPKAHNFIPYHAKPNHTPCGFVYNAVLPLLCERGSCKYYE